MPHRIAVGTAVGGAYVADGELQQGRVGSIAEIGHLPVGVTSERCECGGVGCLDTSVAGWALDRKIGPAWWAQPSPEADAALHVAGVAVSRAARAVGTLYDVDYVLMLGKVFGFAVFWKGFYSEHAGLGADVPITASQSTWGYAARGLGRIAQRGERVECDGTDRQKPHEPSVAGGHGRRLSALLQGRHAV